MLRRRVTARNCIPSPGPESQNKNNVQATPKYLGSRTRHSGLLVATFKPSSHRHYTLTCLPYPQSPCQYKQACTNVSRTEALLSANKRYPGAPRIPIRASSSASWRLIQTLLWIAFRACALAHTLGSWPTVYGKFDGTAQPPGAISHTQRPMPDGNLSVFTLLSWLIHDDTLTTLGFVRRGRRFIFKHAPMFVLLAYHTSPDPTQRPS